MFYEIGGIYYDASEMYAIARHMLEQIDDAYRTEAPVDEGSRVALIYQLNGLEDYGERVYEKYKAWLSSFIDEDYLEKRKPVPESELLDRALDVLDSLKDLQDKIQELRKRVETIERFTRDELNLAIDIRDDAYATVLNLPRLTYWHLIEFLQKFYPEVFQSR
jgi:hypothetical protein